jgi:hypothetical protein
MGTLPPHGFAHSTIMLARNSVLVFQFVPVLKTSKSPELCESAAIMSRHLSGWNYKKRKRPTGVPPRNRPHVYFSGLAVRLISAPADTVTSRIQSL